ncbi:MAG: SIR2 family protein [Caldilineaceae bacterium]|nr:SIR2 family protein [Caldilineaceae bacterium]
MTNIPPVLINAIKEERAVLFLGSGASRQASHPERKQIPQANELREMICDEFLGGALKEKPLSAVSAMATTEAGLLGFQEYIRDLFLPFGPADFHLLIPMFRWRAIATTNFDLIVEKAYENVGEPLQNLVTVVKDGDGFDRKLQKEVDPVGFYKLHGCIDFHTDSEIPLILGTEQYASYSKNRTRLYSRFRDLGYECPIIFVGYSISDPHIQQILFDLTDKTIRRPPFYLVSPKIDAIETRHWSRNSVDTIEATFEDFLSELNYSIPQLAREFPARLGDGKLTIRKYYSSGVPSEPAFLSKYLALSASHIHIGLSPEFQDPREFYRGYDNGWGCITQKLDAKRSITDSALSDAVFVEEEDRRPAELFMLKGPGGNGKTVSLKRIAWEAGVTHNRLVLYVTGPDGLNIEPLTEIHRLTKERIFLFVDRVALVRNELYDLLRAARTRSVPLTVIGAERDNEWNIYCEQLEPFVSLEFAVRYLSEREIENLLGLLEEHEALGLLKGLSIEKRVEKFVERAGRQLLVALHEATLGKPFEDIIIDEFRRIEPRAARSLYLNICALHQFGAPVRAGLISRASGIRFEQFQTQFLQPLENVVHVVSGSPHRDVHYRSRHEHVAGIVFQRILPNVEDRFDLLARLLMAINIEYSSDNETFSRLIRGRGIAEVLSNIDLGRLFYDRVEAAAPNNDFILHQRAVFEMRHTEGSLNQAEAAATRAHELNPKSQSIKHTQAGIARRMANETNDPLQKKHLRQSARRKLASGTSRSNEYDLSTYARLAIDEFKELLKSLDSSGVEEAPQELIESVKDTETTIQRSLQRYPESSELLSIESAFREILNQTDKALQALERAFILNPRQDWLAVRLSRMYYEAGELQKSKDVLNTCLQDNPTSKSAHLQLGRILSIGGDRDGAIEHLRRGFTLGDNRFDAMFWYARELFLHSEFDEAYTLFATLQENAPGHFRTRTTGTVKKDGRVAVYDCLVRRKEEGYAFLNVPQFPRDLFASRADGESSDWDLLENRHRAKCSLAFTRRGPRAISVRLNA